MLKSGENSPDFSLNGLDGGRAFQLSIELKKGPVMMVFIKASCPTCRWAAPILGEASSDFSGPSAQLVFIVQEMPLVAREFVEDVRLAGTVLLDEAPYPVSSSFGISFVPSALLIGSDGLIRSTAESFDRDGLEGMFRELARANGISPRPFWRGVEDVPAFRPG